MNRHGMSDLARMDQYPMPDTPQRYMLAGLTEGGWDTPLRGHKYIPSMEEMLRMQRQRPPRLDPVAPRGPVYLPSSGAVGFIT
jgi:hypothetical protein